MTLADGSSLPFLGCGSFELQFGDTQVEHPVWVAEIEPEGILGLDFFQDYDCELVRRNGHYKLSMGSTCGNRIDFQVSPSCLRVAVDETTLVPPKSEAVIRAKIIGPNTPILGILEPTTRLMESNNLMLARTLVDTGAGLIPLRVLNPSDEPRMLYRNTVAATCEQVNLVATTGDKKVSAVTGRSTNQQAPVPEHLMDLFERSSKDLSQNQQLDLAELLSEFADVFSASPTDLGRTDLVQHEINTGNAAPIRQGARRLPIHLKREAEEHVQDMLKRDIIEPSNSPWASPVVLVKKKDGSTRFCVDYRALNDVTIKNSWPLPRTDDCFDALTGSQWFSTLDLCSGYWQVEMSEQDKPKTAFTTGKGLYQFRVMSFGLCNAPATFERLMEGVLAGLPWEICLLYLDDVIVHAPTVAEEFTRLQTVFQRLRNAKLKLSPKKCFLLQRSVSFLGHVISNEGVSTDPKKVEAVRDWPNPQTVKDVRRFLGLSSYYRRFIKNFADIARPLHKLTEEGREFKWSSECEDAFNQLKRALTTTPVLAFPTTNDPFILDTDASNTGAGAVLSQVQDGHEKVIAYFSRTLTKSERNYCVTRKELLAVILAVKAFHHYLCGKKFLIRTDHRALKWLLKFKNPEGQLARWLELLATYDFTIEHRSGMQHGNADSLSRRPCGNCKYCNQAEQREDQQEDSDCAKCNMAVIEGNQLPSSQPGKSDDPGSGEQIVQHRTEDASTWETWTLKWTNNELRQKQLADSNIAKVMEWKESTGTRPQWAQVSPENGTVKAYWSQWDRLQIRDGVLCRRWESTAGDTITWQLILPESLRNEVLLQLHNKKTAGHLGLAKTVQRVKQRFYWANCSKDVRRWCRKCDLCASRRRTQRKLRAPMQTYNVGAPMERVALDILGPLPVSERGNKYVLVIGDYFSKWTEGYAIPDQEAITVARVVVEEFITRFGVPRQIHSDQGRNFESLVFQEMCKLLGMEKTRTTALHPQSDGMVERFNQTVEAMLSKFVAEDQRDWDEHLPLLMMAYRSAVHETTGLSPCELMLGRSINLPIDLMFGTPEPQRDYPSDQSDYVEKLRERIERTHTFARENMRLESERQKRNYDHRAQVRQFNRGDPVWLYDPTRKKGRSPKLQRPWKGPYIVTSRLDDLVYRIQMSPRAKSKVVHIDRLKAYQGDDAPNWMTDLNQREEPRAEQNGVSDLPGFTEGPAETEVLASPEGGTGGASRGTRRNRRAPAWASDYEMY